MAARRSNYYVAYRAQLIERNQSVNRALDFMDDPNPFVPLIYSSTTLLLVALALAITLI